MYAEPLGRVERRGVLITSKKVELFDTVLFMKVALLAVILVVGACTLASCAGSQSAKSLQNDSGRASRPGLTVVSLNLAMEKDGGRVLRDLGEVAEVRDADVILFQEVVHSDNAEDGVAGELARALNMHVAFAPEASGIYDRGLAVLSRYPVRDKRIRALRSFNLRFHNRSRFALGVTVDTPGGPLRVWNVHLDTRINAPQRIEQLTPVLDEAQSFPGPRIIGGDFNTNDFYWVLNVLPVPLLRRQSDAVRHFMSARGFTAPLQRDLATFSVPRMHLDWVFEKGLKAQRVTIHKMPFSDHGALVVQFRAPAATPTE